jgi:integrase
VRFDQRTVARLPLPTDKHKDDVIYFDDAMPGFGLRIRGGKRRTWIAQYRVGHQQRRSGLGSADKVGLDAARRAAKKLLAKAALGDDPQAAKRKDRRDSKHTLGSIVGDYLAHKQPGLREATFQALKRYLEKHWRPLHGEPVGKIERQDVAVELARIQRESGPVSVIRARVALSGLFAWAIGEGIADQNPVIGTNKPSEPPARDRVLSDAELAEVWAACRDDDYGRIVKLLVLTGQRRDEIGSMARSELDLDRGTWRIPGSRTKNKRTHTVPLSGLALAVIESTPHGDHDCLFGRAGAGFSGWQKAKDTLDRRIAKSRDGNAMPPWRLHDLRRTCATRMADLGVQPHVIEAALNHVSGHKGGVAGVYNRSTYTSEVQAALAMWADRVRWIVEGGERKVVALHERAPATR